MSLFRLYRRAFTQIPFLRGRSGNENLTVAAAPFSISTHTPQKPLPPRLVIPETDIDESFLKGSGPGGQKINKTSSAVQLKHLPTGIVVKCQATRSRSQNRKLARPLLGDRLEEATLGDEARTLVKQREASRKRQSALKKTRRKYKRLADEQGHAHDQVEARDSMHHDLSDREVALSPQAQTARADDVKK